MLFTLSGVSASTLEQNIAVTAFFLSTWFLRTSRPLKPVPSNFACKLCIATTYLELASQPTKLLTTSTPAFPNSRRNTARASFTSRTPRSTEPTVSWFWGPALLTVNSLGIPARLNVVPSSSDASDLKSIGLGSPDSKPNSARICRTCCPVVSTFSLTAQTPSRPLKQCRNNKNLYCEPTVPRNRKST